MICVEDRSGTQYIVKHHNSQAKHRREVHAYRHWVPALHPFAPELVASDPNAAIMIITAVPGSSVSDAGTVGLHRQAGALLRCFHESQRPCRVPGYRQWLSIRADHWAALARPLLCGGDRELIERHLCALDAHEMPGAVPCHLDFQPRNWLTGQDAVVRLIDFEHARIDIPARDFVRLRFRIWTARPDLEDAFLTGYGRVFTDDERQLVWHLGALDALTALARGKQTGDTSMIMAARRTLAQLREPL